MHGARLLEQNTGETEEQLLWEVPGIHCGSAGLGDSAILLTQAHLQSGTAPEQRDHEVDHMTRQRES